MEPYVEKVLNLWKHPFSEPIAPAVPYQMSQQLRSFAALFAPGLFYYYVLDFPNLRLEYVHEGTRGVLGIEPENVTMEKLVEVLLPEEREPLAKKESVVVDFFMNHLKPEEALDYKSVYFFRIKDAAGKTRDMLHQATILTMTSCKKPEFVLVVHTDVSHLKFMKRNNLSFISLTGGKSYFDIDIGSGLFNNRAGKLENSGLRKLFTKREKEVISLIGRGFSASRIAETLNISVHTVRTHRKNLLLKSDCSNTTELVARCLVEGLI